jgi:hypothetical protein
MNCPYCEEPVNHGATVCKTCHRDFSLVMALKTANIALEEKVEELEAELEELRSALPEEPAAGEDAEAAPPPPPKKAGGIELFVLFLLVPILVLVGTHYLLVIRFDTNLAWLRAASIVIPAVFGVVLERTQHPRLFVTFAVALVVAFAAVFGMSTTVHFTDGDAILPDSRVAWRETLEYVASIALSYVLGTTLARLAQPLKFSGGKSRSKTQQKLATLLAKHVTGKKGEPLEQRIQRMVKLIQMGVSAATAIGAIYTGFKNLI